MTEEEWLGSGVPNRMLEALPSQSGNRKLILFAAAAVRRTHELRGPKQFPQTNESLGIVERYADGLATTDELNLLCTRLVSTGPMIRDRPGDWARGWANPQESETPHPLSTDERATLLRDIFGNPFRPVEFSAEWRTSTAVALARQVYESRDFSAMPILAW